MTRLALTLAAAGVACAAAAQGGVPFRITSRCSPNVVFGLTAYPPSNTSSLGLQDFRCTGAAGPNQLFQTWWFYRVDADTREFTFHNGATSGLAAPVLDPSGDAATLTWTNCDGRGFDAELRFWVYSTGATSGVLSERMRITNRTAAPLRLNLYSYGDLDVCDSAARDSAAAVMPAAPQQVVTDPDCTVRAFYLGCASTSYQTGAWPAISDLLTDASRNNLSNTGLPFSPGDWSSAHQWQDVTIGPGESFTAYAALACDFQIPCCTPASIAHHCVARAGTHGFPRWGDHSWAIGGAVELQVVNGLPAARPVMVVGMGRVCTLLPAFGTLAVSPIDVSFNMPVFDANGVSRLCFTLTNAPVLCGVRFDMQAWFLDPGAPGQHLAHTDGGSFTFGSL
jgi:hypothetical protein